MSHIPLCFVLMPFGSKRDPGGGSDINFDLIYENGIHPAIVNAGLKPIRADEERTGGIIHVAMYERLLLCEFAVADLTTANPNVFYELGIRHALRPYTTLPVFAGRQPIPFDVNFLSSLKYELGSDNSFGEVEAAKLRDSLTFRLKELRESAYNYDTPDSPVFRLIQDLKPPEIDRLKTDTFRDKVAYSTKCKEQLAEARHSGRIERLHEIENELGALDGVEAGVVVDLFLSYRSVSAWDAMIALYEKMPEALKRQVMIQEQLGFALNRSGEKGRAKEVLEKVIEQRGPSSETCGILGRVYKDQWREALRNGAEFEALGYLDKAISEYVLGFETDWRDAYPGINAVTLLDIRGTRETISQKDELLPVVRFAVMQRLKTQKPDYWDHATMLELSVLGNDKDASSKHLSDALASIRENWEASTTADNLRMIRDSRHRRNVVEPWLDDVISSLEKRAG